MKKLLLTLALLFCFLTPVHAQEGPFYLDWENVGVSAEDPYEILTSDNIAFNDTYIAVKSLRVYNPDTGYIPSILIERYNKDGDVIATKTIATAEMYSVIARGDYIYMVIIEQEGEEDPVQKLVKFDASLNRVAELDFEDPYVPGVDGMVTARTFGHDILAVEGDYLYVFCGEDYMLKTKLDLARWDVMEYTKYNFAKYFPDLSVDYDLIAEWTEDLYNGKPLVDMVVTTHVYDNAIISSGSRLDANYNQTALIKITDNDGNVIFDVEHRQLAKYIEARIIKGYVVAIGFDNCLDPSFTVIHIYDMDGNLVQEIYEDENHYILLQETKWGFIVTQVDDDCDNAIEGEKCAKYHNEVWYLPLNITTRVISGEGTLEAVPTSRYDEEITFKVTPGSGYELSALRIIDANGNEVTYTADYKFRMPNADVVIEAVFVPSNPKTGAKIGAITFGVLLLSIPVIVRYKKKDKLFNV